MTQPVAPRDVRRLTIAGTVALLVLVAYWTLWFAARSVVASESTSAYVAFENSFPLADGWLGVCVLLAVRAARRQRLSALLWLLCAGGAGIYLFCMDVLYELQHGIYASGAGGLVELGINLLTLARRWRSCAGRGPAGTPCCSRPAEGYQRLRTSSRPLVNRWSSAKPRLS